MGNLDILAVSSLNEVYASLQSMIVDDCLLVQVKYPVGAGNPFNKAKVFQFSSFVFAFCWFERVWNSINYNSIYLKKILEIWCILFRQENMNGDASVQDWKSKNHLYCPSDSLRKSVLELEFQSGDYTSAFSPRVTIQIRKRLNVHFFDFDRY